MITAVLLALTFQNEPAIVLPAPTGRYTVGVQTYDWIDSARIDSMMSPPAHRVVHARIWYPARAVGGETAPYAEYLDRGVNDWTLLHARVRTHSHWRAGFSDSLSRAPVIVWAPGRSTATFDYTSLAEDLASHGYVVVGVDSRHHSKMVLPDGTLAPIRFPSMSPSIFPHGIDDAQEPMNHLVSADLRFAVAKLKDVEQGDSLLRGRLVLDHIGMAGHSNGAMAGSRACALEATCATFFGIEGQQTREIRLTGIEKPYAQVYSEQTLGFDTLRYFTEMRLHARAPFMIYRVTGAGHNTFTDLLLVRPGMFNYPIDPRRGADLTRALTRAWFDHYLLGHAEADTVAAGFPEVRVERYP